MHAGTAGNAPALDLGRWLGTPASTMPGVLAARARIAPDLPAQWSRDAAGRWSSTSWSELDWQVGIAGRGLRRLGLTPGDRVGIIATTSREWDVLQLAVLAAGGVVVGVDAHDTPPHASAIAMQAGISGLVVGHPALCSHFDDGIRARLRFVVAIEGGGDAITSLTDLFAGGEELGTSKLEAVAADAPATIIFTSGTTGAPKGIQYTHRQITAAMASILTAFGDIEEGSRLLCWLPLSNLFQRMLNACAIARGAQTYYVGDPQRVMHDVAEVSPQVFIGVPRFYEKLHAGIVGRIEAAPTIQRTLGRWALGVAARQVPDGAPVPTVERASRWVAERLVFRRLRGIMGGELRYMISGSAPMPRWLLERFVGFGLPILEAYGLSENVIPVCANHPGVSRLGTVGKPMPGNEIRLAQDGELCVRGPGVFTGYVGESPAESAALFDGDGFLATGDYASIDDDGYVTLTGRKSEIFKTSTGRRIAPALLEAELRALPYVEHAVLCGAGRPYPIVILAVAADRLLARAGQAADTAMLEAAAVLGRDVAATVLQFPDYGRPRGAVVTTQTFTIDGGELTPNLKLRRRQIEAVFAAAVEALYDSLALPAGALPCAIDRNLLLVRLA